VHNWLVGFILEVTVPAALEVWSRPLLHLLQFLLGGTNLDTGIDSIGCKRSSAFDIPLVEYGLLNFRNTSDEVIETLGV
jgi:hypothetical protein